MLDWNVSEEHKPLPTDEPTPPRPPLNRKVLIGLLLTLLLIGAGMVGGLWWRGQVVEEQMTTDLLLFIQREEQARRFGLQAQAEQFIAADVPADWRTRYEDSFVPPATDAISVTISLGDIEWQGNEALVQVQMGRQNQQRRYRQTDGGWQRVPLVVDTSAGFFNQKAGDTLFAFSMVNQAFGQQLIQEYPDLIEMWGEWRGTLPTISNVVGIHHDEFVRPVYLEGSTLHVSNPTIITLPAHWDLSGEEAVRYWVAREIGVRIRLLELHPQWLPGNARFINALVTVSALRWAVADEPYTRLTDIWREAAAEQLGSSFYDKPNQSQQIDPFAPNPQEAAALLIAEALYQQDGQETIAQLVQHMSGAQEWDTVFRETMGFTTLEFETLARGGPMPNALLTTTPIRGVPLPPTLSMVPQVFQISMEGYASPIWVQVDDETTVMNVDGTAVAPECATAFSEIEIEGEWFESGLRLNAEQIRGTVAPVFVKESTSVAPNETLYYISKSRPDATGNAITDLIAVSKTNEFTTVWSRSDLRFEPMFSGLQQFLLPTNGITAFASIRAGCELQWLLHYTPTTGEVQGWLFDSQVNLFDAQLFGDSSRRMLGSRNFVGDPALDYLALLEENGMTSEIALPATVPVGDVALLRPGRDELLIYARESNQLLLYDWERGQIPWKLPARSGELFTVTFFDPTGRYLYVTHTNASVAYTSYLPERSKIVRYDLETGAETLIWDEARGGVGILTIDANGSRLYSIVLLSENNKVALMKYENDEWSTIIEGDADQLQITNLKSCEAGGAMVIATGNLGIEVPMLKVSNIYFITAEGLLSPTSLLFNISDFPIAC